MRRLPVKSRVLKRRSHWLVILPSGRQEMHTTWWLAHSTGVRAVQKERDYEELKATPFPRGRNAW